MSLTGRPGSPPLALTSSSQIFIARSDILPLAASGPVSAMPKPMDMGSAARAGAAASTAAAIVVARATTARVTLRRCNFFIIVSSVRTWREPSIRFLPSIAQVVMRGQKHVEDARERAYAPRIHLLRKSFLRRWMDCRVKPGNDDLHLAHMRLRGGIKARPACP